MMDESAVTDRRVRVSLKLNFTGKPHWKRMRVLEKAEVPLLGRDCPP